MFWNKLYPLKQILYFAVRKRYTFCLNSSDQMYILSELSVNYNIVLYFRNFLSEIPTRDKEKNKELS